MLEGRDWFANPPASADELKEIRRVFPKSVPDSYFDLLAHSNGGEGPLPVNPFNFCLDPIVTALDAFQSRNYERPDMDGFLVIGGDGSRELIAFDMRVSQPGAIVTIDIVEGPDSAEQVATDFEEFVQLIGQKSA
jgi:hypothetical protein